MENASKALIIAGAILLAILIIGLGMLIFNQAKDSLSSANLDKQTIETFNSEFEAYVGENVKGSRVRALCDAVRSNNLAHQDDEDGLYTITLNDKTLATEINEIKNGIKNGKVYKVSITDYKNTGLVDKISITE